MPDPVSALARAVTWQRTAVPKFLFAARVDGTWWVLRLNSFPDHPHYTLFIDGTVIGDVEDLPTRAPHWNLDTTDRPALTAADRDEVRALMRGLEPYGSEVGQPCDGDWCSCGLTT
jgi:hypothetical protein